MLDDYFNLNDEKEEKNYYLLISYNTFISNKIGVDIVPKELKRKDKIINKTNNKNKK